MDNQVTKMDLFFGTFIIGMVAVTLLVEVMDKKRPA